MEIKSRVPGVVEEILVKEGDQVHTKDAIMKIEAMKMQQSILTPVGGEVTEIRVEKGDHIKAGQVLAVIE